MGGGWLVGKLGVCVQFLSWGDSIGCFGGLRDVQGVVVWEMW